MKFTTRRAVCSSSAPCKYEKICVNFHGLVQEQRCVVCFETCAVIWKIYLAELLLPSYSFSGFSGSFTEMRRKDIRLKKRSFICQSTTARVMGALFALTGVGELCIALDARWSAVRMALQSQMIGVAAIVVAIFVSWSNFDQANLFTWGFVGGMLFLLIASPMLYLWLEVRRRKGAVVGKEPSGR
jgi:hypothetical protein